jgi:hypothetical protein
MMWLNYPTSMVRTLTAERRRDVSEDRPSAIVGLASSGVSRAIATVRRLLGFRTADEACSGC